MSPAGRRCNAQSAVREAFQNAKRRTPSGFNLRRWLQASPKCHPEQHNAHMDADHESADRKPFLPALIRFPTGARPTAHQDDGTPGLRSGKLAAAPGQIFGRIPIPNRAGISLGAMVFTSPRGALTCSTDTRFGFHHG